MYIRRAKKSDAESVAKLMRMAIMDIAEALTGEEKEEQILRGDSSIFQTRKNRLSYENCFVCDVDGSNNGVGLCYFGGDAPELDEPLVKRLRIAKNDPSLTIEKRQMRKLLYRYLGVDPAYHRQGMGTSLIQFVEQYAKENGYERLSLVVEQNNTKAQKLYTRLGYIEVKKIVINHHEYEYRMKIVH